MQGHDDRGRHRRALAGSRPAIPSLLPLGSVIRVDAPVERYSGIWTVMDTGPEVKGREVDLYVWSCNDALAFGRRSVRVTILRLGWDPQQSAPGATDPLFRQRERARPAPAAEPPPDAPPAPLLEAEPTSPLTTPGLPPEPPPAATPASPTTPATRALLTTRQVPCVPRMRSCTAENVCE